MTELRAWLRDLSYIVVALAGLAIGLGELCAVLAWRLVTPRARRTGHAVQG